MNRKIFIPLALTAVYIVLCAAGIAGLDAEIHGIVFRLAVIAALLYAVTRAFAGVAKRGIEGAVLAGVLGLGMLAASEVYTFCHIYLLGGGAEDITVAHYSRPCAYLFFITAVLPGLLSRKVFQRTVGVVASVSVLSVFAAVIANAPVLLGYADLLLAAVCILPAIVLLTVGGREGKGFALSLIALCVVDSANRLLILMGSGQLWRDIAVSLYPIAYILICTGLRRLGKTEGRGG